LNVSSSTASLIQTTTITVSPRCCTEVTLNGKAGRWDDNIIDIDATLQEFFDSCHAAGPELCAFYAPSPEAISANLTKIYEQLQAQPIPVYNENDNRYAVVSYEYLRGCIFASLHTPYVSWPSLAAALADLAKGDGKKALTNLIKMNFRLPLKPTCDTTENEFNYGVEVAAAITCNDASGGSIVDYDSVKEHLKHLLTISEWGSVWEKVHTMCAGWPNIQQPRFQGPVGSVNTSYPILLVGNRHGKLYSDTASCRSDIILRRSSHSLGPVGVLPF